MNISRWTASRLLSGLMGREEGAPALGPPTSSSNQGQQGFSQTGALEPRKGVTAATVNTSGLGERDVSRA